MWTTGANLTMEDMSATVYPLPALYASRRPESPAPSGATVAAVSGTAPALHRHRLGDALHAIRVYLVSAIEVTLFGEYYETVDEGLRTAGLRLRRG